MIAKLRGTVDAVGEDWAVIDVAGVGYLVSCAGRTLAALQVGQPAVLFIETQVREDRIQLFGFLDAAEREWFRLLQTVQGVGGRVALAILSALAPDKLVQVIASADRAALTRADGVGPKLATRVLAELKEKAGTIALGQLARAPAAADGARGGADVNLDAVSALVNLGYGRSEAFGAISSASKALGERASIDALIKAGLKELSL
ncbi:MAG TPA: Holliday junction branch migration protein RuvA [Candidatus Sulfotelmatobacter sp.]|nr:Holliday junction branch migration protein RuvA [Candidatus Sulfotelmatobacter sp.]